MPSETRLRATENYRVSKKGCDTRAEGKVYISRITKYPLLVRIVLEGFLDAGNGAFDVDFFQGTHDYRHAPDD